MTDENDQNSENENQENESQESNEANEPQESNEANEPQESNEANEPQESNEAGESEESSESEESEELDATEASVDSDDEEPADEMMTKIGLIEGYETKMRLLRWGLLVGVISVMAYGLWSIYDTAYNQGGKQVMEMYDRGSETYDKIKPRIDEAYRNILRIQDNAEEAWNIFDAEYTRLEPKTSKAYKTLSEMAKTGTKANDDMRAALENEWKNELEPYTKKLIDRAKFDLQDDLLGQVKVLSSNSDEILANARKEYHKLTNSLPDVITSAIQESLVTSIQGREEKLREDFPKLTKEKQAAVVSRLSAFSDEQREKIFVALFKDHLSELGTLQESMDAIYDMEGEEAESAPSIETTIALLSALLDIAMSEFDVGGKRVTPTTPPKPDPKPAPQQPKPKGN